MDSSELQQNGITAYNRPAYPAANINKPRSASSKSYGIKNTVSFLPEILPKAHITSTQSMSAESFSLGSSVSEISMDRTGSSQSSPKSDMNSLKQASTSSLQLSVDQRSTYTEDEDLKEERKSFASRSSFYPMSRSSTFTSITSHSCNKEEFNNFVLIFDKSSGSPIVYYLLVDTSPHRPPRLLPQLHSLPMPKLTDIINYRAVALNNYLYIIGGRHAKSGSVLGHIYCYDPMDHSWRREASMLRARTRFTACVLDGCIYVCGGELRGGHVTASVECYDPISRCWTDMKSLPHPRVDHDACVAQGGIFISGGTTHKRGGSHAFWFYDPAEDHWSEACGRAILPAIRENHAMMSHKGDVYCMTGLTIKNHNKCFHEVETGKCWRFSKAKSNVGTNVIGVWDRDVPDIMNPRANAGCVTIGHYIYMIGGYSPSQKKAVSMVEYFNVRRNKWIGAFSLGEDSVNFQNVDCVLLKVHNSNHHFSHLGFAMKDKWVLW